MRIVTRPDFDGVVCAVLLYEVEDITEPVKWVEPSEMQKGEVNIRTGDIIANLPYRKDCSLWFDHHFTNKNIKNFKGAFKIAPSAAGLVYEYYKDKLKNDYKELIKQTDKIDSADLSLDEVMRPEKYPYILLSMTVSNRDESDKVYWNKLVDLLRKVTITKVLEDLEVKQRCDEVIKENQEYLDYLKKYTKLKGNIAITDFRSLDKAPSGNRFLVYSLFPESIVHIKIRYYYEDREKLIVSVGHSIFNKKCKVNVGLMLSNFEGGGHKGAGACRFHASKADDYLPKIIDILIKNKNNE
ncbi:Exopolyphosphatase [Candidatus Magnetomoraceae bacterium gMMP-13]